MAPPPVSMTPEAIAQFQADPNQWLRQLLEGQFLGANPYLADVISQIEADAQRQFQESILPTRRSELNLSGAYGTALGSQAEAKAAEDFARGLMGQTAGIRYQDYGSERDRMMQGLQLLSGETLGSRQGLFGSRDTDVQAAAQRAAANMSMRGQLGAARTAAGARMHNARLAQQSAYWNNLFNRSQQMRGFFGGPQQSLGQRTAAPQAGALGAPGLPGFKFAQGPETIGGDPWNTPGGF